MVIAARRIPIQGFRQISRNPHDLPGPLALASWGDSKTDLGGRDVIDRKGVGEIVVSILIRDL